MLTRRVLRIILAAVFAVPSCVFALGVGQLEVRSAINQPFEADLPLIVNNPAEVMGLSVRIPRQEDFDRIGIERLQIFSKLRLTVDAPPGGRPVVKITSREPIRNPNFSLLVEMLWPRGRLIRQFPVQLDPELYANRRPPPPIPPVIAVVAPTPAAAAAEQPSAPAASLPPALPASFDGATTYGPVRRGENLSSIARRVRPSDAISVPQMMATLLAGNPGAFTNGNPDLLQVGATLKVPTPQALGVQGAPPLPAETVVTPPTTVESAPPTVVETPVTVTPPTVTAPTVTPPTVTAPTMTETLVTPPTVTPPTVTETPVTPPITPDTAVTPPATAVVPPTVTETPVTVIPPETTVAPVTPPTDTSPAGGPQEIVPQGIAPVGEPVVTSGTAVETTPPTAPETVPPVTPPTAPEVSAPVAVTPPVAVPPAPVRPVTPPVQVVQAEEGLLDNPLMWLALALLTLALAALILMPLLRRRARLAAESEAEEVAAFEGVPASAAIENPFSTPSPTQTQVRDMRSIRSVRSEPTSSAAALGASAAALAAAAATPSQRSQTPRPIKELLKDFEGEPDSERLPSGLVPPEESGLEPATDAPGTRRRPVDVFAEPPTEPLVRAAPAPVPAASPEQAASTDLPSALRLDGLDLDLNEFSVGQSARISAAELPPLELKAGPGMATRTPEPPFLDLSMSEPATEPPTLEPQPVPRQETPFDLDVASLRAGAAPKPLAEPVTTPASKPGLNFEFSGVTQDLNIGQDQLRLDEDLKNLGGAEVLELSAATATPDLGQGMVGGMSAADYVETKLDLASAYLDMGDKAGARGLIEEVMREGDTAQKQRAEEFLRKLG